MKGKYRVLIAEDEYEIGRALSNMVDSHPSFEVVAVVTDGSQAMRHIDANGPPDVLITDIRMPVMDGLALIELMRERNFDVRIVIVSGYDHFEYARKALVCGASNYLLKPIRAEDCQSMLDGLLESLQPSQAQPFDLSQALGRRDAPLPPCENLLYLYAICFGNFPFAPAAVTSGEAASDRRVKALYSLKPDAIALSLRNGIYYMLCDMVSEDDARRLLMALRDIACSGERARTVAMSRPLISSDIASTSVRLVNRMRRQSVFAARIVIDAADKQDASDTNAFGKLFTMEEDMVDSIRYRDYSVFRDLLKSKFDQWRAEGLSASSLMDYVRFQYVYAGQRLYAKNAADKPPIPYDWENSFAIAFTVCESWTQLFESVFGLFSELFNAYQSPGAADRIAVKIEAYIEENYAQRVTNQSLAKLFGFVPSYISKLFKEYKGLSPGDFLTKTRIENAQRIIRETGNVNLCEIAMLTGFSDPSYFSKIFKKQVGMTPTEYRNMAQTKPFK